MTTTHHERSAIRSDLLLMTEALVAEFAGLIPAGSVMRCVSRCREELMRAGITGGLVQATETMARQLLSERIPSHACA